MNMVGNERYTYKPDCNIFFSPYERVAAEIVISESVKSISEDPVLL